MSNTNSKDTTSVTTDNSNNKTQDSSKKTTQSTVSTNVSKDANANTKDKSTTVNSELSSSDDEKNTFKKIFSSSNIILVVWFLAIYLLTYIAIRIFNTSTTGPLYIMRLFDAIILVLIFTYIFINYYSISEKERDDFFKKIGKTTRDKLEDPYTLLYTGVFLVCYSAIIYLFQVRENVPISLWLINGTAGLGFALTAIVVFCKYVLDISILDNLLSDNETNKTDNSKTDNSKTNNIKTDNSKTDKTEPVATAKDEVFNISNNLYTYDDARAVCSAFGARLATYDEIENAYTRGGEWCNYGWSEGQMAFFPTQKATWDKLQKNPKTKNNCGRPGVNGGYMENPYIKFGVNCFGQKPKPTDKDLQAMSANKNALQPKTEEDLLMEKKVQFWKENADKLLKINSFNQNKWSVF
jgi:hypothetical protein